MTATVELNLLSYGGDLGFQALLAVLIHEIAPLLSFEASLGRPSTELQTPFADLLLPSYWDYLHS